MYKFWRYMQLSLGLLSVSCAGSAWAVLPTGQAAPDFTLEAAMGGKAFSFNLAQALKRGPVVLYFYPAAFTKGCTIEAHNFAEATDEYARYGATVLGVSADGLDTLKEFSVSACRSKFAVAADPERRVIDAYDARSAYRNDVAARISYVIAPGGSILYEYTDSSPDHHVANTLRAVQAWAEKNKPGAEK